MLYKRVCAVVESAASVPGLVWCSAESQPTVPLYTRDIMERQLPGRAQHCGHWIKGSPYMTLDD